MKKITEAHLCEIRDKICVLLHALCRGHERIGISREGDVEGDWDLCHSVHLQTHLNSTCRLCHRLVRPKYLNHCF